MVFSYVGLGLLFFFEIITIMSMFEGGAPCVSDISDTVNPDSASVSDADTVQNTNAPSCLVEGEFVHGHSALANKKRRRSVVFPCSRLY